MKNFNWEEFKKGKFVVHCDTLEKANDFLKYCHNNGMTWYNYDNLLNYNYWYVYKKNTCYKWGFGSLCYAYLSYYKENHYKIIEWEIEEIKFNWSDFKQGRFAIKLNNKNREQFIKEIKKECKDFNNLNFWNYNSNYYYYHINNNKIECDINVSGKPIIDFIPNTNNDKYEIYITSNGTTTNCVYKLNDKVVNKSSAKLNPIDKFDFKEGAKICIDRVFKDNIIKKGTKFRVINVNKHTDSGFVCLDAYIGEIGIFDYDSNLKNPQKTLSNGTFEKEYINAIDKENGKLIWHQSEIEILED